MLVFKERGKPGAPGEKSLRARTRTNNKLNPHMTPSPGIEPGPYWWEVIAHTTAPSFFLTKKRGGCIYGSLAQAYPEEKNLALIPAELWPQKLNVPTHFMLNVSQANQFFFLQITPFTPLTVSCRLLNQVQNVQKVQKPTWLDLWVLYHLSPVRLVLVTPRELTYHDLFARIKIVAVVVVVCQNRNFMLTLL